MAIRKYVRVTNTPALHSNYYNSASNISAKSVSVASDRYKLNVPSMILDIGGSSYNLGTYCGSLSRNYVDYPWDSSVNVSFRPIFNSIERLIIIFRNLK